MNWFLYIYIYIYIYLISFTCFFCLCFCLFVCCCCCFFFEKQSQLGARRRPVGYFKNTSGDLNLELLIENPREYLKQNQLAVRARFELRAFYMRIWSKNYFAWLTTNSVALS